MVGPGRSNQAPGEQNPENYSGFLSGEWVEKPQDGGSDFPADGGQNSDGTPWLEDVFQTAEEAQNPEQTSLEDIWPEDQQPSQGGEWVTGESGEEVFTGNLPGFPAEDGLDGGETIYGIPSFGGDDTSEQEPSPNSVWTEDEGTDGVPVDGEELIYGIPSFDDSNPPETAGEWLDEDELQA